MSLYHMRRPLTICARCLEEVWVTIMSKFNRDIICMPCKADEKEAPNYAKADQAEFDACRSGNLHFPGIGLAPEDEAFLAERRNARRRNDNAL